VALDRVDLGVPDERVAGEVSDEVAGTEPLRIQQDQPP